MAKKRTDLAAAKKRKQKILLIVGALVLGVLLFIQVPRTMKMLDPGAEEAAPPPPAQTEQPAAGSAGAPGADAETPAAASPLAASTGAAGAKLVDTDAAPEPDEGDLASFERFSSKDPFVQQVKAEETAPAFPASAAATPTTLPVSETPTAQTATAGASTAVVPVPSTTPTQSGSTDSGPAKRASAEISVNGKPEIVTVGRAFPKAEPAFRLVAVEGDSVKIGIASGGKFTSGAKAMTLRKGKPLALVNTEDGSRYDLILLSVG